jgi:putative endonuclease
MSFEGKQLGARGDELAAEHLQAKGYSILQRNFRTKRGEIDIIALDGDCTVFVEVKSFQQNSWSGVSPLVNMTREKQQQVIRVAQIYMARCGRELRCRFDVVAVRTQPELFVEHYEGAFTA